MPVASTRIAAHVCVICDRNAVNRLLSAALAVQFQELLANPDDAGDSRTSYRYVLAPRPQAVAAPDASGGDD